MSLLTIRTRLKAKPYFRLDLTDDELDKYINMGIRFLNRKQETPNTPAALAASLTVGDYALSLSNCPTVRDIYIQDSSGNWTELSGPADFEWMIANYPKLGLENTGTPLHWGLAYPTLNLATTPVYIMPPSDGNYMLSVVGWFTNDLLSVDADTNWWDIVEPDLLTLAAAYSIELERGGSKLSIYEVALERQLFDLDKVLVDQSAHTGTVMERAVETVIERHPA